MKKEMIWRIATTASVVGWMCLIFSFSAQPAVESSQVSSSFSGGLVETVAKIFGIDMTGESVAHVAAVIEYPVRKAAHMTEYAIMGLLSFAFYQSFGIGKKRYLISLLTAAAYAATDELHQLFVPGRSGRISDVCIDTIGVAIGLLILYFVLNLIRKHCEKKNHPLQ